MEGVDLIDRLLAYRADRDWSQARLSEESGVAAATIANIERGTNPRPRRITLMRFAQAFGVSLDEFLSDAPPKGPGVPLGPALELEAMYVADAAARREALEGASDEERERYAATIDRVIVSVLRGIPEWEGGHQEARETREALWRHISRLMTLHAEATGEDEEPPQEDLAGFIAEHASVVGA